MTTLDLSGSTKGVIYNMHKLAGLFTLLLVIVRIAWRFKKPWLKMPHHLQKWQCALIKGTQILLYSTLIALPISGWLMSAASNHLPHIGNIYLAAPGIGPNQDLAKLAASFHYYAAWVQTLALFLHSAGALWHRWLQDGIFNRMFP